MTRTDILNQIIKKCGYTTYLEIGVQYGVNFKAIDCDHKVGVDPEPLFKAEHPYTVYKETSDEYFIRWGKGDGQTFDLIFIDGLHHADQVLRDYQNSLKVLSPNGTIVFHDCNPPTELHQRVPRESKEWNGDVWKAWAKVVETSRILDQESYCIDTDFGVGVISFHEELEDFVSHNSRQLSKVPARKEAVNYKWLSGNRKEILNLISVEQWTKIIEHEYD